MRLADALRVPQDRFLNAFGLATRHQRDEALTWLDKNMGGGGPKATKVPVITTAADLDAGSVLTRTAFLSREEDVFMVDLGPDDTPYSGEALVSREREPKEGQGILIDHDKRLRAGTYHTAGRRRKWVVVDGQDIEDFRSLGVIIRYTTAIDDNG